MGSSEGWAVIHNGVPITATVRETADEAWYDGGFEIVAGEIGGGWRERFWKRPGPSRISARRRGYLVGRVRIEEVERG